jgi:hypothetical protein
MKSYDMNGNNKYRLNLKTVIIIFLLLGMICFPKTSSADTIEIKLVQVMQSYENCKFIFIVVNKTKLNITTIEPYVTFRERDGTIIDSVNIGILRLKPGKEAVGDYGHIYNIQCSVIGSVEFKNFWGNMVEIDGNQEFGKIAVELADGVAVTSSVPQVQAR